MGPHSSRTSSPDASGALVRDRLFERLTRAGAPAAWIGGPPGTGKTTLVATYLKARHVPSIWCTLDGTDGDAASFFHHLSSAMQRVVPTRALPALVHEYVDEISTFSRRWFQDMFARLDARFSLVLDDCDQIPPNSPVHGAIRAAMAEVPGKLRMFVLSRGQPPPSCARLQVNGTLYVLPPSELMLTDGEAANLARLRGSGQRSADELRELNHLTQGWITGFGLMLDSGLSVADLSSASEQPQLLYDYLAAEVFDRASPSVRRVLLETAPLPVMTTTLAQHVTGIRSAGAIVERLAREGQFTTRYDGSPPSFQYHPLLKTFLLQRGEQLLTRKRLHDIRCRAAELLANTGHSEFAIKLWLEERRFAEIARVAVERAPAMLRIGLGGTVRQWLQPMPDELLDHDPRARMWLGIATALVDPVEGRAHLARSYDALRANGDASTLYTAWSHAARAHLGSGETERGHWIAEWNALRMRHPNLPAGLEPVVAPTVYSLLQLKRPPDPELPRWERACMALIRPDTDVRELTAATLALIFDFIWTGRHAEMTAIDVAFQEATADASSPITIACRHVVSSACRCYNGWPPRSIIAGWDAARVVLREHGLRLPSFSWHAAAAYAWNHGDSDAAERFMATARFVTDPEDLLGASHLALAEAFLALLRGKPLHAIRTATIAVELASRSGDPTVINAHLVLALALLGTGEPDAAAAQLSSAETTARAGRLRYGEFLCSLGRAALASRCGSTAEALEYLRVVASLGASAGIVTCRYLPRDAVAHLCALAISNGIAPEYFRDIARKQELPTPPEAAHLEGWPHHVTIYTLGHFQVWVDGELLSFGGKVQRRPLDLLKALVAMGGAGVDSSRLADELWPDTEGDGAQRALEITLHRLRKLIRHGDALVLSQGRLSLDPCHCWVDAIALERRLDEASAFTFRSRADPTGDGALADLASKLHRGPFLPDDDGPSVLATRMRLRSKLVRFVDALEQRATSESQQDEARRLRVSLECYALGSAASSS